MGQMAKIGSGSDVIGFLKAQHLQITSLFEKVIAAAGSDREEAFRELRRLMAVHETAEEEIVHPAARRGLINGEAVVRARLHEENEAKKALAKLEELGIDTGEFETEIQALRINVLAHAEAEESEEFNQLAATLDEKRLRQMRKAVVFAESIAPTRPHAGIESAAANMLVGPFASMVDRARDALTGKS